MQHRSTSHAVVLHMRLQLPVTQSCSFLSPFFEVQCLTCSVSHPPLMMLQVRYKVEVDFFLDEGRNGQPSEPFSWAVPLDVLPVIRSCRSALTEAVACLSSNTVEKGCFSLSDT